VQEHWLCCVRYIERNILMRSLFCWDLTKRRLLVSYRHFGTTYASHFQRWSIQRRLLKMGPIGCPETSATTTLRCVKSLKCEVLIYPCWKPGITRIAFFCQNSLFLHRRHKSVTHSVSFKFSWISTIWTVLPKIYLDVRLGL